MRFKKQGDGVEIVYRKDYTALQAQDVKRLRPLLLMITMKHS